MPNALTCGPMPTSNPETARRARARRPKLASTEPGQRALEATPSRPSTLARLEQNAKPFLVGVGVGAAVTAAVVMLTSRKPTPPFTLFAEPKSKVLAGVAKVALVAIGRALLRRGLAHAAEKVATPP